MKTREFSPFFNQKALENQPSANHGRTFRQCRYSLMDTIADPYITFDDNGISNYYYQYKKAEQESVYIGKEGQQRLSKILAEIRNKGKNQPFDCLIGLSGGVDSTYLCLLAKEWKLRPLILHLDNHWNAPLASENIKKAISKLGFHIEYLTVDPYIFKCLQRAYLLASVVDVEVITDHAMLSSLYKMAYKYKIPYILAGMNVATEQVLPQNWIFNKEDASNIVSIFKQHGEVPLRKLKNYPLMNYARKRFYTDICKIKIITPLNYMDYRVADVKKRLHTELDWQDYGNKHYESAWTRFYQSFLLPHKFNIDKRKAHLSNLIFSGQLTKKEGLQLLQKPLADPNTYQNNYENVLEKLGFSKKEFMTIMQTPRVEHSSFDVQKGWKERLSIIKGQRSKN